MAWFLVEIFIAIVIDLLVVVRNNTKHPLYTLPSFSWWKQFCRTIVHYHSQGIDGVQCLSPYSDSLVLLILICVYVCTRVWSSEVVSPVRVCVSPTTIKTRLVPSLQVPFYNHTLSPLPTILTPGSHYLVLFWGSFGISQMLYKWNYTVLDLLRLLLKFGLVPWRCFQVVARINTSLLVITE